MGNDHSSSKEKFTNRADIPPDAEVIGNYLVEKVLGKGSFAEVKLGRNIHTGERVALKVIQKSNLAKGKRRVHLQREIRFLKLLSHPHIAMLYEVIEEDDCFVLIMEHVGGGELLEYVRGAEKHRLSEDESRRMFRQVVSGVDYCHQNFLLHRDLKPENILLDENKDVKIIDFGFSREFKPEMQLDSFIGSPHYAAPELLQGIEYSGPEVDIWSLGVVLFVMVCGKQPFKHPDMKMLYAKIISGVFEFPDFVSEEFKDLIANIIQVDPKKRLKLEQIKNHPWVCKGYDGPPETFMEPREKIQKIDEEILKELLSYGFTEQEARNSIISNEVCPVTSFYHLLAERKRLVEKHDVMEVDHDHGHSPKHPHPLSTHKVKNFSTGEEVDMAQMEKNIRTQVFRRQSSTTEAMGRRPPPPSLLSG